MKSWARQQLEAEMAAGKARRRANRVPSKWGKAIAAGSEDEIQASFFEWVDTFKARYPVLELFYAIPNGSNKSKTLRWVMKLTGLRSGVPDVCLPYPRAYVGVTGTLFYSGLFIEFKRPGERPTPNQKEWILRLKNAKHRVEVCTSWMQAANIVIDYLGLGLEPFKL